MLSTTNICKDYAQQKGVLQSVNFQAKEGEITVLAGLSGSGKSTLLKCIAGIETPTSGEISLNNKTIFSSRVNVSSGERNCALVFQNHSLFPHLSALENVEIVMGKDVRKEAASYLELVGLSAFMKKLPGELSGGQQQRVAIARALAYNPSLILFDEPLSSLDVRTAKEMRSSIHGLLKEKNITAIWVAHHMEEAFQMADRLAVLHEGKLLQEDTPQNIYNSPVTSDVALLAANYLQLPKGMLQDKEHVCYRLEGVKAISGSSYNVQSVFFHEGKFVVVAVHNGQEFQAWSEAAYSVGDTFSVEINHHYIKQFA